MSSQARVSGALAPFWLSLRTRWQSLALRERRLVTLAAALLLAAFLWFVAIAPALKVVRSAPAQLAVLDTQLQAMQRDATEVRSLRAVAPVSAPQSAAALRAATDALGGTGRIAIVGDRATLTLAGASAAQLRDWLADTRSTARARVVEANLTHTSGSGGLAGTVVVTLPEGGP
jgi:general secretion pathway protein M